MGSGPVAELISHGYLFFEGTRLRTTRRWQAALARAALRLRRANAPWTDLRLPIAAALAEGHGQLSDEALAVLVEAMVPVEERELSPAWGARPAREAGEGLGTTDGRGSEPPLEAEEEADP
jgi:hypothetical protein